MQLKTVLDHNVPYYTVLCCCIMYGGPFLSYFLDSWIFVKSFGINIKINMGHNFEKVDMGHISLIFENFWVFG